MLHDSQQPIDERNQQRRQLIMIWPKMEAMKMACRNNVQRQDIDELQKRMILRATMRFWKEQQKLEKNYKSGHDDQQTIKSSKRQLLCVLAKQSS